MQQPNFDNKQSIIPKSLPHNFLAEKMILNCLLNSSEAIEKTLKILSADAFYFKNHQEIYKAIIIMYNNQLQIDAFTLTAFLQDQGLLQKVGGIKVLIELINQVPNLIYLDEYLILVRDKFVRRSLIRFGYEAINSSYVTSTPLENILTNLENKLFNLANNSDKSQNPLSSAELLNKIFFELKENALNPKLSGLATGFYDLDSLTQGFQKSDLIILAGRPSMGKTALGLNFATNIMKSSNLPVLFFSLEMSKEQIMYRLLSMESDISQSRLRSGRLNQNDWIKLNKIITITSKLPFFVDDASDLSISDIRLKIKTIIFEQAKIGLVIIDYLQLMQTSESRVDNRVQELSKITRSLKNMAKEFNIPIIALSQLSRNIESRVDKKPILSDLRESGSIEQDADLVLMLHKNDTLKSNEFNDQNYEIIIAKQRNGPIGIARLKFDKYRTKFSNWK